MAHNKDKLSNTRDSKLAPQREYDSLFDQGVGLLSRFQRFTWDFSGVLLLAVSLITLIALFLPSFQAVF